jgi:Domain of unknown function (DUF4386)
MASTLEKGTNDVNPSFINVADDTRFVLRLTAGAGFVVVLMAVASTVAPLAMAHPGTGDSAQRVAAYMIEQRGSLIAGTFLLGLGWGGIFPIFVIGLHKILRPAEGGSGILCSLGTGGGIALAAMLAIVAGIFATAVLRLATDDPASARALYLTGFVLSNFSGIPTCVNAGAFSAVMLQTGVIPRWIGWLGLVAALVHIVAAGSLASDGPMSPVGLVPAVAPVVYVIWVLAISVVLASSASNPKGKS